MSRAAPWLGGLTTAPLGDIVSPIWRYGDLDSVTQRRNLVTVPTSPVKVAPDRPHFAEPAATARRHSVGRLARLASCRAGGSPHTWHHQAVAGWAVRRRRRWPGGSASSMASWRVLARTIVYSKVPSPRRLTLAVPPCPQTTTSFLTNRSTSPSSNLGAAASWRPGAMCE